MVPRLLERGALPKDPQVSPGVVPAIFGWFTTRCVDAVSPSGACPPPGAPGTPASPRYTLGLNLVGRQVVASLSASWSLLGILSDPAAACSYGTPILYFALYLQTK